MWTINFIRRLWENNKLILRALQYECERIHLDNFRVPVAIDFAKMSIWLDSSLLNLIAHTCPNSIELGNESNCQMTFPTFFQRTIQNSRRFERKNHDGNVKLLLGAYSYSIESIFSFRFFFSNLSCLFSTLCPMGFPSFVIIIAICI